MYPFLGMPWNRAVANLQSYPLVNAIVKFGVAFPFAYHFAGGVRHLVRSHFCRERPAS